MKKHPSRRVIHLGASLGGGVSIDLAARHDCAGFVLMSTFSSMPRLAKEKYPWLSCYSLMSVRFENDAKIGRCRCPIVIIHGADDDVIPSEHSRRLFEAAEEPKKLMIAPGGHGFSLSDEQLGEIELFLERKWHGRLVGFLVDSIRMLSSFSARSAQSPASSSVSVINEEDAVAISTDAHDRHFRIPVCSRNRRNQRRLPVLARS